MNRSEKAKGFAIKKISSLRLISPFVSLSFSCTLYLCQLHTYTVDTFRGDRLAQKRTAGIPAYLLICYYFHIELSERYLKIKNGESSEMEGEKFHFFFLLASCHEIHGFEDLKASDLVADDETIEALGYLLRVGPDAPNEVRLGVDQSPQQIVQSRVEVLRQRRHRLVSVLPETIIPPFSSRYSVCVGNHSKVRKKKVTFVAY